MGYTPIMKRIRVFFFSSLLWGLAALAHAGDRAADRAASYYEATYHANIRPDVGVIDVELRLSGDKLPSRIVLHTDAGRHGNFTSTDPLQIEGSRVTWQPRGRFSRLRYEFRVDHERSPQRYDSRMTNAWALFRGEKLVPRATVKAARGLQSRARLEFTAPDDWKVVTPYAAAGSALRFDFDDPERRFDRPKGWMLAGKIGSRAETIGGVTVVVAAPVGDGVRRQDTLAFLNWTLPRLLEVFPHFPQRVLVVGAGDPMWRGGLSGPASMFLHADRPLISENRTSTLLHELVHVATRLRGDHESDWIVEGLAEYYSIETLRRSGSVSERRYSEAMARLEKWARSAPTLFHDRSDGATTARAVLALQAVDAEIRKATAGKASMDDVARKLAAEHGTVTLARLQQTAREIAGKPLQSLERDQLMKPVRGPTAAPGP